MTTASLNCVVEASLKEARRQVQAYSAATMDATVMVQRTTGVGPLNYSTGLVSDQMDLVYSGPGQYSVISGGAPVDLGDEQQYWDSAEFSIPFSAPPVKIDDIVTILAGPDPAAVGRTFRVRNSKIGGALPSRRSFVAAGTAPYRGNR